MYAGNPDQIHLPDVAKWVEPNDSLANGRAEVYLFERHDLERFVLLDLDDQTLYVVGRLMEHHLEKLRELVRKCSSVILETDQDEAILSFFGTQNMKRIFVFTKPSSLRISPAMYLDTMLIDYERLSHATLGAALQEELIDAFERSPISATFVESKPVAFCYAASQSSLFWDVSVDTLVEHRRKGLAKQCALHMISLMESKGKQVVWQSFEDNPPSWKLAQSIGLAQTDQLLFFKMQNQ